MYQSFWVDKNLEQDVKALVRQYPSIRFKENPLEVGLKVHFCLTGDVEDFNSFNVKLDELESGTEPCGNEPVGLFQKVFKFFKKL